MITCSDCEYESRCFPLLKFIQRYRKICQQGRKRREWMKDQTSIVPEEQR